MRIIIRLFSLLIFFQFVACESSSKVQETVTEELSDKNKTVVEGDITLDDIPIYGSFDDMKYIFEQESDTTYVINFWATWCKPCVEELPYFEELYQENKDEKLRIILVSLDFPNKLESQLVPFINEHKLSSEVMVLADGRYNEWIDKVSTEWGGDIPVTVVYKQKDRKFHRGTFPDADALSVLAGEFFVK